MKRALQGVGLIPLVPLLISSFLVRERDCNHKITFRRIVGGNISDNSNHSDNRGSVGVMNGLKTIMQVRFLCLSFALFFIYGGMLLPFNYIPQFAEYNGKRSMGNNLLAICYSGSVVGRIGTGALADHFGT